MKVHEKESREGMEEKTEKASCADPWFPYILMRRFWRKTACVSAAGDGDEQNNNEERIWW